MPPQPLVSLRPGTLILLAACHFAAFVDRSLPAVFAPSLKQAFGLSDTQIGALQGPAFVAVFAIATLLTGTRHNRLGVRSLLVGCLLLWTLASLAFALSASYEALLASRLLLGLGQAAFAPTALRLLTQGVPAPQLGRATSVFTAGSATGRSGALLIGGLILVILTQFPAAAGDEPWRLAIVAMVVPNLILVALLLRQIRGTDVPPLPQAGLGRALARIARHPLGLGLHILAASGIILMVQAAAGWVPSIFNRSIGLSPADSALLAGAVVLVAAPIGHMGAGWLLDRHLARGGGPGVLMVAGAAVAVAGASILAVAQQPIGAVAGLTLITAGGGAAALVALAAIHPLSPPALKGSMVSLYLAIVAVLGSALGPLLTGVVSDRLFPHATGLSLSLVTVMGTAGLVVTASALAGHSAWMRLAQATRTEAAAP
ncbi:MFS transporter [Brevundimonas vitis]|uniref:MFS transporter n=1 Tax=Brevundimonas vitisensis TaxID=2800818 RepID=A0ABX7BTU5_9CAUL|nr:MFS transporter [Brevundimonas vitisensis]QQQ19726.1 MFS transporter [Brevundimonas vitisensis]